MARPDSTAPVAGEPNPEKGGSTRTALLGAMFLMATSAVGPGFITQTTEFTIELGAAFAFAILASIVIDFAVQMNVWRVVGVSGIRAHELGNKVLPGVGYVLAGLVVLGGLVFNIGNTSGAGLGTDAMFGLDPEIGGAVSALIAIGIFLSKRAGVALDRIIVVLGAGMIVMTAYTAIVSKPPLGEALKNAVLPEQIDFLAITTIVGGTVGGYITYAGAHRLLDSGISGPDNVGRIQAGSVYGILVTGVMRTLLFLAILGVTVGGAQLADDNPTASAFETALGSIGGVFFGVILWAASITSVIGAAYTSVTFLTTSRTSRRRQNLLTVAFIALSAGIFVVIGAAPVDLLVFAGAFNGLILPIGFTVVVWVAWMRRDLLRGYAYPMWLRLIGLAVWVLTLYLGWKSLSGLSELWS
ncbi:NRAMP family divalent metal transporter [Gordonia sp. PKS22-38]|uniref:NRAMP family divalent metal transporter n=1 Tax=Gordonia prachuapensis TaxID=3115651 RepID=A0ABU7MT97_9ACTN|nr:NRAMP family divalent metal transporter [Gordonia sp. PKS22-38]